MPPNKLLYVQVVDMDEDLRKFTENLILDTFENNNREDIIAGKIKFDLDLKYNN